MARLTFIFGYVLGTTTQRWSLIGVMVRYVIGVDNLKTEDEEWFTPKVFLHDNAWPHTAARTKTLVFSSGQPPLSRLRSRFGTKWLSISSRKWNLSLHIDILQVTRNYKRSSTSTVRNTGGTNIYGWHTNTRRPIQNIYRVKQWLN